MKNPAKAKEHLVKEDANHEDTISLKPSEESVSQRGSDQLCQSFDSLCTMRTENAPQGLAKQDVPQLFSLTEIFFSLIESILFFSFFFFFLILVSFTGEQPYENRNHDCFGPSCLAHIRSSL